MDCKGTGISDSKPIGHPDKVSGGSSILDDKRGEGVVSPIGHSDRTSNRYGGLDSMSDKGGVIRASHLDKATGSAGGIGNIHGRGKIGGFDDNSGGKFAKPIGHPDKVSGGSSILNNKRGEGVVSPIGHSDRISNRSSGLDSMSDKGGVIPASNLDKAAGSAGGIGNIHGRGKIGGFGYNSGGKFAKPIGHPNKVSGGSSILNDKHGEGVASPIGHSDRTSNRSSGLDSMSNKRGVIPASNLNKAAGSAGGIGNIHGCGKIGGFGDNSGGKFAKPIGHVPDKVSGGSSILDDKRGEGVVSPIGHSDRTNNKSSGLDSMSNKRGVIPASNLDKAAGGVGGVGGLHQHGFGEVRNPGSELRGLKGERAGAIDGSGEIGGGASGVDHP